MTVYRYKSRLVGQGSGWNRTPSEIVKLMEVGAVEVYSDGSWSEAEKVSGTSFRNKKMGVIV